MAPPLRAPGKAVHLRAVRPNPGLKARYREKLQGLLKQMRGEVLKALELQYESDPPETLAGDEGPAAGLRRMMRELTRRWEKRFADLAAVWGPQFVAGAAGNVDRAMRQALRKAGFTVKFRLTPAVQDVLTSAITEQVNLIKSIPSQLLVQVETHVTASVQAGRDIGYLKREIQQQFGVSERRADLIARSQNEMATATITRARQQELGIEKARWLHSAGGRKPRPEHVAFSAGRHAGANHGPYFNVAEGAYLEGKWTWPGVEINCRCVSISIIPGIDGQ